MENMMKDKQHIILYNSKKFPIVNNLLAWGMLIFAIWFNYNFIDGNNFLDTAILVTFFLRFIGLTSQTDKFYSYEELIAWAKEQTNEH